MANSDRNAAQGESRYPERLSVMVGVIAVIAATLPRYVHGGHDGRLILILVAAAVIAVASFATWRMMEAQTRRRVPPLLVRLMALMLLSGGLMGLWQLIGGKLNAPLLLSHGATLGLILHALLMGWRRSE